MIKQPLHPENFEFPVVNRERLIDQSELWVLSYYRSSELAGSLLMGKMARRVDDDEMRSRLTWHFAEEARHAWKWTELIRKLGANPLQITETYQSNYFGAVGIPKDILELLAITQVFEKRVARHFAIHRMRKDVHPLVRERLGTMCCEEGPHVQWVKEKLAEFAKNGKAEELERKLRYYQLVDSQVYIKEARKFVQLGWDIPESVGGTHERCQEDCAQTHS